MRAEILRDCRDCRGSIPGTEETAAAFRRRIRKIFLREGRGQDTVLRTGIYAYPVYKFQCLLEKSAEKARYLRNKRKKYK